MKCTFYDDWDYICKIGGNLCLGDEFNCESCDTYMEANANKKEDSMKLVLPCCKTELPAPLDGVALVICHCGLSYDPEVIIEYNKTRQGIKEIP